LYLNFWCGASNKKTAYQKPISSYTRIFTPVKYLVSRDPAEQKFNGVKLVNPAGSSARKKLFQGGARRR
jgi:hypothetical protein